MKSKINWQKKFSLLGVVLTIVVCVLSFLWVNFGREIFSYQNVVITTDSVKKGDSFKREDIFSGKYFKVEKRESSSVSKDSFNSLNEMASAYDAEFTAIVAIPSNMQITKSFFDNSNVVLKNGQFYFKVPPEWLVAIPSSIRRKDTLLFYEVDASQYNTISSNNKITINDGNDNSSTNTPQQSNAPNMNVKDYVYKDVDWLKNFNFKDFVVSSDGKAKMPLVVATAAYIKDSANREVVTVGDNERYDGSSQVSSVEIIADFPMITAMEKSVKEGNKFIILYQDN